MRTAKSQIKRSLPSSYVVLAAVLLGLFVIGIELGRAAFAPQSQTALPTSAGNAPSGAALVNPPFQVHDFPLRNQADQPMSLKDLRGRSVLLFFGYTHCPDVCPTTLADFTRVKTALGTDAAKVAFVFVSIDSERDTPGVIKDFLNNFDPGFIGLTGDEATLRTMAAEYGSSFVIPDHHHADAHQEDLKSDNYFVEHTSPSFLIDAKGYLRMVYFYGTPTDIIASGIRQMWNASN